MIKVEILRSLIIEIKKKFNKNEANEIIDLLYTLEENPNKGKIISSVGGILIKELKYKTFRFYFITDGFKLRCLNKEKLIDLLLRFIRMSDKKTQQKVINEIKEILIKIGPGSFE